MQPASTGNPHNPNMWCFTWDLGVLMSSEVNLINFSDLTLTLNAKVSLGNVAQH